MNDICYYFNVVKVKTMSNINILKNYKSVSYTHLMLLYLTDNFLRARTTVGSEAIHTDDVGFQ